MTYQERQRNLEPLAKEIRLVTFPELRKKLEPYIEGWPWGKDSIRDLWLMGAPVPHDKCPQGKPCEAYPKCNHIRRVLLPSQFAKWWDEAGQRMGKELGAHILDD